MDSSCCANPGAKQTHEPQGKEEEIAGVKTYKTGQGKSVIVLFSDVFGYSFVNTRKVADRFARSTGTTVLIPDYFHGDALNISVPNYRDLLPHWLERHPVSEAYEIARRFVEVIKEDYQSIQIIGFCYGGKVVVQLISTPESSAVVKAAAVGHPSMLVKEEATQIQRPILFLCAEYDHLFSPELEEDFRNELSANDLGIFHKYPGTVHGFITRPDGSEMSNEGSERAIEDAITYFQKNIKIPFF